MVHDMVFWRAGEKLFTEKSFFTPNKLINRMGSHENILAGIFKGMSL